MKKLIIFIYFIVVTVNLNATVDYKKDHSFFERACKSKASYLLNKEACDSFTEYEQIEKSSDGKIEHYSNKKKYTADQLAKNIREINIILDKKNNQINKTKSVIKENRNKIKSLEKDAINLIASMQYVYDENQLIDIIMGSSNLTNLMTEIDGLSNFNKYYQLTLKELDILTIVTENKQRILNSEIKNLNKLKREQSDMLNDFRRKEANIYNNMQSGGNTAKYNTNVDNIDLSKINDSSLNWRRPLNSGNVSSIPWSYPNGGWHPAIDIATQIGSNVIAPANGVIIAQGESPGGYGKHIVVAIKKDNYIYTMIFAHLSDYVNLTSFKKGNTIAKTGNTGMSTGPHVHVEVLRHNTSNLNAVINQYKKNNDYWFGLGYSSKGNLNKVARIKGNELFKLSNNQSF